MQKFKFETLDDFLVERQEIAVSNAGIKGFIIDQHGNDPLAPLGFSNDDNIFQLFCVLSVLRNDLHDIKSLPKEIHNSEQHEKFIFKLFAINSVCIINATLYALNKIIKTKDGWDQCLTNSQVKNINGKPKDLRSRIKYTFQSFSVLFDLMVDIDVNSENWKEFKKSLEIRAKLAHPSLNVFGAISEEDMNSLTEGWNWFAKHFSVLLKAYCEKVVIHSRYDSDKPFVFYPDIDLQCKASSNRSRDKEEATKRRKYFWMSSLKIKKEFINYYTLVLSAGNFREDCSFIITDNEGLRRRVLVLGFFSELESINYMFREVILIAARNNSDLILKRASQFLERKIRDYSSLEKHLRQERFEVKVQLIPSLLAYILEVDWAYQGPNEASMVAKFVTLRDRIAHPKKVSDLSVSDEECILMHNGHGHILAQYNSLIPLLFGKF